MSDHEPQLRHHCGEPVESDATWCLNCSQPVVFASSALDTPSRSSDTPRTPEVATSSSTDPAEAMSPVRDEDRVDCGGCGRPLASGARRCEFCREPAAAQPARSIRPARDSASATVTLPGGLTVAVTGDSLMLGRLSPDDRVGEELDRDEVSREHANVWFDGSAVYLEDLGSTNGTWLAGRRITTRVRLPTGDVTIGLGRRVTVMVHVP